MLGNVVERASTCDRWERVSEVNPWRDEDTARRQRNALIPEDNQHSTKISQRLLDGKRNTHDRSMPPPAESPATTISDGSCMVNRYR